MDDLLIGLELEILGYYIVMVIHSATNLLQKSTTYNYTYVIIGQPR